MGNFMDDPLYPQRGQNGDSPSKSNVSFGDVTSGIGSIIGAIDSLFGFSQRRQENAQKRLMEQQQQYWNQQNEILYNQQVEQWNRENEYNDPTNAYKRLLDGAEANGLSKAQVLNGAGSQVQSQGASGVSAPGSVATPSTSGAPVYSMGQGVMNSMRQLAEIDLMESEAERNRADAGLKGQQVDYYASLISTEEVNRQLMSQNIATDKQREESLRLDNFAKEITNGKLEQMTQAQLDKLFAEIDSIKVNTDYREKELGVFDQQFNSIMDLRKSQMKLYIAEAYAQNMLAGVYKNDARYKAVTLETLRQTLNAKLQQLLISNTWAPIMNYKQSMPTNLGEMSGYTASALKGNDPFSLANQLLQDSIK